MRGTFTGPKPRTSKIGNVILPWGETSVATVCGPSKVLVHVTKSTFDLAQLAALPALPTWADPEQVALNQESQGGPGAWYNGGRTGFPIEGPFLRYQVAKPGLVHQAGLIENAITDEAACLAVRGNYDPGDRLQWVFDLMGRRTIFLPFPGELSIIGNLPGSWEWESWVIELAQHARWPSPIDSEFTLTAQVAPDAGGAAPADRLFNGIPKGAHSFTYRDTGTAAGVFPKFQPWFDDAGKNIPGPGGAPLNAMPSLVDFNNQSSQYYGRWGLANAAGLFVTSAANGSTGEIQFHLSVT